MTFKHYYILLLTLLMGVQAVAQKTKKEQMADEYFMGYSFDKAIEMYKTIPTLSPDGQRKLAQAYVNTEKYKEAEELYAKIVQLSNAFSDDYLNYASVLKMNGKYDEANVWMNKYKTLKPGDLRVKDYDYNKASLDKLLTDVNRYRITNLDVNTDVDEFAPAFYTDKILFTTNRDRKTPVKHFYNWNQKPFLDIYLADVAEGGEQLINVRYFDKKLNEKYHEGPAAYSYLDQTIAYTKNNYSAHNESGAVKLNIYFKTIKNNKWQNEIPFKWNNNEYNVAHPWLSHDGNTMYFASDMPGGYGGVDLYKVNRDIDGNWGKPVNLGASVNTEGNEMFPFVEEVRGALFFTSNGHQGLGGMDIFAAPLRGDTAIGKALNMGFPLNSQFDDFGLIINDEMTKGYFSSNRVGGKGGDDIYSFQLIRKIVFQKVVKGVVKNDKGELMSDAFVKIIDDNDSIRASLRTKEDGAFAFDLDDGKNYKLHVSKAKYDEYSKTISTLKSKDLIFSNVMLSLTPDIDIRIKVADKAKNEVMKGALVKVFSDGLSAKMDSLITSESGTTRIGLPSGKLNTPVSYTISVFKEGYFSKTIIYKQLLSRLGKYDVSITLNEVKTNVDLAILFETGAFVWGPEKNPLNMPNNPVLEKIVQALNDNPKMVLEIGVHTACEGPSFMNTSFSQKRAEILSQYLKFVVREPLRISAKGYGESKLKNKCACEGAEKVDCTPEEHKENERVEFMITRIEK